MRFVFSYTAFRVRLYQAAILQSSQPYWYLLITQMRCWSDREGIVQRFYHPLASVVYAGQKGCQEEGGGGGAAS